MSKYVGKIFKVVAEDQKIADNCFVEMILSKPFNVIATNDEVILKKT